MKTYFVIPYSAFEQAFLDLPRSLYGHRELTQNLSQERDLVRGEHLLSSGFEVAPFVTMGDNGHALARGMVTLYPGEECAYFGFFECVKDPVAAADLFQTIRAYCEAQGRTRLFGPLDASFWLGYRLKLDSFGSPYTGEPYNLPYYEEILKESGFSVMAHYTTNYYDVFLPEHDNPKQRERLHMYLEKGFRIASPDQKEFDQVLPLIYTLLTKLYADFPMYHSISCDQFCQLFSPLKKMLDYRMVKLAWEGQRLRGFFIGFPNYGAVKGKSLSTLLHLNRVRRNPREYVMLYLGADSDCPGLGSALAQAVKLELQACQARTVGALVLEGKHSSGYFQEQVERRSSYALYSMEIDDSLML